MKRAYRERALARLYRDLGSGEFDVREDALFQLALLLRRVNDAGYATNWAEQAVDQLPRDLRRIQLAPADIEQIVANLLRLTARYRESQATAIWVLAAVPARAGFEAVAQAIRDHGEQLSDEAAFQACKALAAWLDECAVDEELARQALVDLGTLHWLERWSRSAEGRRAGRARAVIELAQGLTT